MERVAAWLVRIYFSTWGHRRILRSSSAASVAAFTLDGDETVLLFAGPLLKEWNSVYVFMSGTDFWPQAHSFENSRVGQYGDVNVVTTSLPLSTVISHCDHCFATDQDSCSPYCNTVFHRVERVRRKLQQGGSPSAEGSNTAPFARLHQHQKAEDLVNELMNPSPGPFADAEQHLSVTLEGEDSVASVQAAIQKFPSYSANSVVRLHIYVNWDCCDYSSFMLLRCYPRLRDLYAVNDYDFHINIYGHARYTRHGCQGVQHMIDSFPEEISKFVHFTVL